MVTQVPQKHRAAITRHQMPAAESLRLGDLVSDQQGTVVSRALLKHATGTVTVFAFDAGQGLSEHTAAFDALVQMLAPRHPAASKPASRARRAHALQNVADHDWLLTSRHFNFSRIRVGHHANGSHSL